MNRPLTAAAWNAFGVVVLCVCSFIGGARGSDALAPRAWELVPADPGGEHTPRLLLVDAERADAWRDLQSALDAARPGDVVWVRGGVHPAIRITKGVHLLAHPPARIAYPEPWQSASGWDRKSASAIEIRTRRNEDVTLAGLIVEADLASSASGVVASAVRADGCGKLVLIDCRFEGGSHAPGIALGAFADGAVGVDARNVEELWISRSLIRGGKAGAHASTPRGTTSGDGATALLAPDALVLALRSQFIGGDGGALQLRGGPLLRSRTRASGRGGVAVEARLILDVNSQFIGGAGAATMEGRRQALRSPSGAEVRGKRIAIPDQLEVFRPDEDSNQLAIVGHQAWGEHAFLACSDRMDFDEQFSEDENYPFLDLRTAQRIDVVPSAEVPIAPGLIEVLFELEGHTLSSLPGIPALVQLVRQTPSGEARWSNPEILLRWPELP